MSIDILDMCNILFIILYISNTPPLTLPQECHGAVPARGLSQHLREGCQAHAGEPHRCSHPSCLDGPSTATFAQVTTITAYI